MSRWRRRRSRMRSPRRCSSACANSGPRSRSSRSWPSSRCSGFSTAGTTRWARRSKTSRLPPGRNISLPAGGARASISGDRTERERFQMNDSRPASQMAHNECPGPRLTRRTFGEALLAGLASVGTGISHSSAAAGTTAEPEGPDHLPRRRVKVLDTEISYVDTGSGEPVVFLHGNPTWSYQWRNIIPYLSANRRCLAPDFVGMGWSGKSPGKAYRFVDQARYLDAWFDALELTRNVTLVGHDWGGPIAFYRARRYPAEIKAIAYFEAIAHSRRWDDFPGGRDRQFRTLRSPDGERLFSTRICSSRSSCRGAFSAS